MKDRDDVVIYVHGANYISTRAVPTEKVVLWLYSLLNVVPDYTVGDYPLWLESLREKGYKVIVFKWPGGVWPWQIMRASRDLKRFIEKDFGTVDIISQSIGTWIALKASKKTGAIRSIISVCGVHRHIDKSLPFVEIASAYDLLERAANFIINIGRDPMPRELIVIPHKRHDEFTKDFELPHPEFKEARFSDLLVSLLRRTSR